MEKIFVFKKDFRSKGVLFPKGRRFKMPKNWKEICNKHNIKRKHYYNLTLKPITAIKVGIRLMIMKGYEK